MREGQFLKHFDTVLVSQRDVYLNDFPERSISQNPCLWCGTSGQRAALALRLMAADREVFPVRASISGRDRALPRL